MIEVKYNKKYMRQISYVVLGTWVGAILLGVLGGVVGIVEIIDKEEGFIKTSIFCFACMIFMVIGGIIEFRNQYKEDKTKYEFTDMGLRIITPYEKNELIPIKCFKKLSFQPQMIVVGGPKMGYTCSDGYRIMFKNTKTQVIEIYKDYHENYEQFEEWCRKHGF
jgi:predicted transcriptional regulator